MIKLLKDKWHIIIVILNFLFVGIIVLGVLSKSFAFKTIYEKLPENSIIVGDKIFENYVGPTDISNAAIDYYKRTGEIPKFYKYNGLDIEGIPIWSKYSDKDLSYVELDDIEKKEIESIIEGKYSQR